MKGKGRPPKPTKVLKLEKGDLYGAQKERQFTEPQGRRNIKPKCPRRFKKDEKREWRFFSEILENYGLFDVANAFLIELLAINACHYKRCLKDISKRGIIIKGPKGGYMYNPYFAALNKIEDKIQRCLSELGLSSNALARIGAVVVKRRKDKDEMEGLLD